MSSQGVVSDIHPLPSIVAAQTLVAQLLNDILLDNKYPQQFTFALRTIQTFLDKAESTAGLLLPTSVDSDVNIEYVNNYIKEKHRLIKS